MNLVVYSIIALVVIISYNGFNSRLFFEKYMLRVGSVINGKEYYRLLSSGFLHADWTHLFFNMFTFYFFGPEVLFSVGYYPFLLIYVGSLVFGNLAATYFNRDNFAYSAIGASGAVSGIIFAAIILNPDMGLYIIPIPFAIPGWLFGFAYVLYSVYGMKKQIGNIGHSAHLGGAIGGLFICLMLYPMLAINNWQTLVLIIVPLLVIWIYEKTK